MNRMPVAERREQLIAAARAVASREGIDGTTVRAVAAEAGVSLGVVHYCFEDKDELLRAVADSITAQNLEGARRDLPEDADLPSVLEVAIRDLWEGLRSDRGAQLLSYELTTSSLRHAELAQVAPSQYQHGWDAVELFLTHVASSAGIRWATPVRRLARLVLAVIDGYSLAWLVDGNDAEAQAGLQTIAAFLTLQAVADDGSLPEAALTLDTAATAAQPAGRDASMPA